MTGGAVETVDLAAGDEIAAGDVDVGDVGTPAERPGVVDEGADLGLAEPHRTAARSMSGSAIGIRPVRRTKSTAARPSGASDGPSPSTP